MKTIIPFIFLFAINLSFAQYTISGKILDAEQNPVNAGVVSLLTFENGTFVKAAITNEDGTFNIKNIDNGDYKLFITSLGFKDYNSTKFSISTSNKSLEIITLETDSQELGEVTITAEKPLVQVLADKTVFNVQNAISVAGDSGFELLRKAPGVLIDNNDNLIVEGKVGVLIYIDDKPSVLRGQDLVNYLKTIQATDIDAVEIITQPSSKYDAEGNAGIINIKFKRDKSLGTNGSLASGITVGDFARYNNSVSLNNRSKKTSLFGSFSNRFGESTGFINLYRQQNNTIFDARTKSIYDFNNNNIRLGFDYFANTKSTFGIILTGNFSDNQNTSNSRTPIIPQGNTSPTEVLVAGSNSDSQTSNIYGNLNYKLKLENNTTLNVDLDFGRYNQDRTNLQPNQYFDGDETQVTSESTNFMDTPITIDIATAKIDYEQDFLKGKLSLGAKYSKIVTDNQFDFYDRINDEDIINQNRTNTFNYDENINAAYFNFNRKYEKFNFQVGLRVERTNSDGILTSLQEEQNDRVKRKYTDWFPSGGITYQLNEKNAFALSYSKRVQRPNYQSLNPFEYQIDELSFSRGNPFLKPQYTDNLKLSHTYNYRLSTSLSYSFVKDFSAQVTEAVGDDQNFLSQRNVANQKVINLGVSYPTSFNKWWSLYFSLNAYKSIYEATNEDFLSTEQNTLSLYAQNTFKITKNFSAEVSGWYSSPSVWGGTYETKSLGSLNIAFQKKFLDDALTARLGFNDILYTSPWRGTTQFGDLRIDGSGGGDSRQVQFSLTYNFGSNDIKKARNRDTGIEDEKNRI
jgi:outer membrane receptor protein involved in Fe transport